MNTIRHDEVHTVVSTLLCECGGTMVPDGRCLTTSPPQYLHVCEDCGESENYRKMYPCIEYVQGHKVLEL